MRSVVGTAMNGYGAVMTPSECRGSFTARHGTAWKGHRTETLVVRNAEGRAPGLRYCSIILKLR